MCDITHSYVRHDSFMCVMSVTYVCHASVPVQGPHRRRQNCETQKTPKRCGSRRTGWGGSSWHVCTIPTWVRGSLLYVLFRGVQVSFLGLFSRSSFLGPCSRWLNLFSRSLFQVLFRGVLVSFLVLFSRSFSRCIGLFSRFSLYLYQEIKNTIVSLFSGLFPRSFPRCIGLFSRSLFQVSFLGVRWRCISKSKTRLWVIHLQRKSSKETQKRDPEKRPKRLWVIHL